MYDFKNENSSAITCFTILVKKAAGKAAAAAGFWSRREVPHSLLPPTPQQVLRVKPQKLAGRLSKTNGGLEKMKNEEDIKINQN